MRKTAIFFIIELVLLLPNKNNGNPLNGKNYLLGAGWEGSCGFFLPRYSTFTLVRPFPVKESLLAAARLRSISRRFRWCIRSVILTMTDLPLERLVTRAQELSGRVLLAAVSFFWVKISPLAVRLPSNLLS